MATRARPWKDKDWLVQRYIMEGHQARDIAKEAGCHHSCISYWLARHGIKARGSRRVLHQLKCPECNKVFNVTQTEINLGRTFCSHGCQSKMMGRKKTVEHITKKCPVCEKEFEVRPSEVGRKYCSKECAGRVRQNRETRVCPNCGKEFKAVLSNPSPFCSRDCRYAADRTTYTCVYCGKDFTGMKCRTWLRFCSPDCRKEYKKKFPTCPSLYPSTFNDVFKTRIRERDNYTCAICRLPGRQVHHVNYCKDDTNYQNCITLCSHCHPVTNGNRTYWELKLTELMVKRDIQFSQQLLVDIRKKWNFQISLPGF